MAISTPVLAPGEGKKILMIVLVCFAVAHARRKAMRKRWLKEDDAEQTEKNLRWVDHPFVPYVLENAYIIAAAVLLKNVGVIDPHRRLATLVTLIARSIINTNLGLLFQRACIEVLYKHVPYFSATKPSSEMHVLVSDYLVSNFIVDCFNAGLTLTLIGKPEPAVQRVGPRKELPIYVFPYLGKLFFGRIVVDIVFYLVHRWMHSGWAYKNIHARHHEHPTPRLQSNFHFGVLDLFLGTPCQTRFADCTLTISSTKEGPVPIITSSLVANALGIKATSFEQSFMVQTFVLFKAGSHSGKEVPIVTWFPPLSPIVDYFIGCDQRLIEYHTRHHQLFNCNYSISPWPDKLMGSYKMEYKVPGNAAEDATRDTTRQ